MARIALLILALTAPAALLAQGPATVTSGGRTTGPGATVQTGAGTTDATTTGASGADKEAAVEQPQAFACFNIEQPGSKARCFRALKPEDDAKERAE